VFEYAAERAHDRDSVERERHLVLSLAELRELAPRAARRVRDYGMRAVVGQRVALRVEPFAHERRVWTSRVHVQRSYVVDQRCSSDSTIS
jgi:non-ribosomal peptide synthetase component F